MKNRFPRSSFSPNKQVFFPIPADLLCRTYGVATFFEARFAELLFQWLFTWITFEANSVFMDIVDLWRVRVLTYNHDALIYNRCYKHDHANRLGISICEKCMQDQTREQITAAWEQFRIFQTPFGAALDVLLNDFGAVSQGIRFHVLMPSQFQPFLPFLTSRRQSKDWADDFAGSTLRHRFCTIPWWEISHCVIGGLVAYFAARAQVSLMDDFVVDGFGALYRPGVEKLQLFYTLFEVFIF